MCTKKVVVWWSSGECSDLRDYLNRLSKHEIRVTTIFDVSCEPRLLKHRMWIHLCRCSGIESWITFLTILGHYCKHAHLRSPQVFFIFNFIFNFLKTFETHLVWCLILLWASRVWGGYSKMGFHWLQMESGKVPDVGKPWSYTRWIVASLSKFHKPHSLLQTRLVWFPLAELWDARECLRVWMLGW